MMALGLRSTLARCAQAVTSSSVAPTLGGAVSRRSAHTWDEQPQEWKHRMQLATIIERTPTIHLEYTDYENLYIKYWMEMNDEKTKLHHTEFAEHGVKFVGKKGVQIERDAENERARLKKEAEEREYQGTKGFASEEEATVAEDVFVPAPKLTEDEHDHRSLNRRLMGHLYLIVKDKATGIWRFPHGPYKSSDGLSLRVAAKRVMQEHVGKRLRVHMIGNGPRNVVTEEGTDGGKPIKTFFYHGRYRIGDVKWNQDKIETHAWVNLEELNEYVGDEYFKSVRPALFNHNEYPSPHIKDMI